jgi:hypothetical protein
MPHDSHRRHDASSGPDGSRLARGRPDGEPARAVAGAVLLIALAVVVVLA